ncbi:MAG: alpha/beta hydrolase, partial [Perlucidibaca sp.]
NKAGMVAYFRLLAEMNRKNRFAPRVRDLKVPTLLLWGARDRWVPPALIHDWQRDVPGLTVRVYPDGGHIPMEELPAQSAHDALSFLQADAALAA